VDRLALPTARIHVNGHDALFHSSRLPAYTNWTTRLIQALGTVLWRQENNALLSEGAEALICSGDWGFVEVFFVIEIGKKYRLWLGSIPHSAMMLPDHLHPIRALGSVLSS